MLDIEKDILKMLFWIGSLKGCFEKTVLKRLFWKGCFEKVVDSKMGLWSDTALPMWRCTMFIYLWISRWVCDVTQTYVWVYNVYIPVNFKMSLWCDTMCRYTSVYIPVNFNMSLWCDTDLCVGVQHLYTCEFQDEFVMWQYM